MEYVYPLSEHSFSAPGEWVDPTEAWFADHPFVVAHPEMFSAVPPRVHPMEGRSAERPPLEVQEAPAPARRGRGNG